MKKNLRKLCIVGAGGFGREVFSSFKYSLFHSYSNMDDRVYFMDDNPALKNNKVMGIQVIQFKDFIPSEYEVVIAVGNPHTRKKIVEKLPEETQFATLIHPSSIMMNDCYVGEGSIITAGCLLTCNIIIGKHAHLNLHTTVGHDCRIGDYFTTAPGAHISGECEIGNCVYFGTNASVRQGIRICDDTVVGMGGVVVKKIEEEGTYIGNPLKRLVK